MADKDLFPHIIEIKERLARIDAKQDDMKEDMNAMMANHSSISSRVIVLESNQEAGKAQLRLIKWIAGVAIAVGGMLLKAISALKTGQG